MPARIAIESPTRAFSGETHAYVIGTEDSLLVDPAAESEELTDAIEARTAAHVAVTHHHPDHVAAVANYASRYDLTVWALAGRERAFEQATGIPPDRTFRPGTMLPVAGGVKVIYTPGHAPEHLAFDVSRTLDSGEKQDTTYVTGDLAVAAGSVVVGAPDGDMRAYLTSLRRIYAANPDQLLPAHGPVIEDPRATCERLLRHRLDREQNVIEAVNHGHETPDEILDVAYEKDVSDVRALARATIVAHLEKLAVEGDIRWDGTRAIPANE